MKLKTYETPEVDLLRINTEVNFMASLNVDATGPDLGDPYVYTETFDDLFN